MNYMGNLDSNLENTHFLLLVILLQDVKFSFWKINLGNNTEKSIKVSSILFKDWGDEKVFENVGIWRNFSN